MRGDEHHGREWSGEVEWVSIGTTTRKVVVPMLVSEMSKTEELVKLELNRPNVALLAGMVFLDALATDSEGTGSICASGECCKITLGMKAYKISAMSTRSDTTRASRCMTCWAGHFEDWISLPDIRAALADSQTMHH